MASDLLGARHRRASHARRRGLHLARGVAERRFERVARVGIYRAVLDADRILLLVSRTGRRWLVARRTASVVTTADRHGIVRGALTGASSVAAGGDSGRCAWLRGR